MYIIKNIRVMLMVVVLFTAVLGFASTVLADDPSVNSILESTRSKTNYPVDGNIINYPRMVGRFVNVFLSLLGVIFVGQTIYAGYLWMTARGDQASVTKAKDILEHAIIGIIIVISAYAITEFLLSAFGSKFVEKEVTGY